MNPWKVFFHPARAARLIHNLNADNKEISADNARQASRIHELQDKVDSLTERIISMQAQIDNTSDAYRALHDDLLATRKKLDSANFEILQLDALRNDLARTTAEKKDALRRVDRLKESLNDLRMQLREVSNIPQDNELTDADGNGRLQFPDVITSSQPPVATPPEEEFEPRKIPLSHPSATKKKEEIQLEPLPSRPSKNRTDDNNPLFANSDDDWLQPLPSDPI